MGNNTGYPIVRAVFILLLSAVLVGDLALLFRMGAEVLSGSN